MAKIVETPLMKQYFDIKAKHPDAILLFRVGDFYEMYGEDAVTGAEILGIVQTKKANGPGQTIEMAGFPHHALDSYLSMPTEVRRTLLQTAQNLLCSGSIKPTGIL